MKFHRSKYRIVRVAFVIGMTVACGGHTFAQVRNLVFEGAGVRGIAYVGALRVLEEEGLLNQVEKVGGTSAGAIAALTVSLGCSPQEIEEIIYGTRIQKFNDGRFFFFGGVSRLNRRYGWYRGKTFTKWISRIIADKTGDGDITFRQLRDRGFRDLYVTGTSLNNQQLIVFSCETYPDMKVRDAIRISVSIPLYFEAVCIDAAGNVVDPKRSKASFDIMVDGGFTANFPIWVFDSVSTDKTLRIPDMQTLGFRLDSPSQIALDTTSQQLAPLEVKKLGNYIGAIYNYVIENLNRASLTDADWDRTVSISSANIGPRIRKLSMEEKDLLLKNGRDAMRAYLQKSSAVTR